MDDTPTVDASMGGDASMGDRTFLAEEGKPAPKPLCSILCSSSCRNMNDPSKYTPFQLFGASMSEPIAWPERTDVCCWWCCHGFDTVPVCVPSLYSLEKRRFEVFGIFCSWNCAKAYVQSNYSSDSSEQLMWMRILAHEYFGCNVDQLRAAPPRIFLRMFGGHLSIEDFRQKSDTCTTTLLKPPLVSYPIVLQETPDKLPTSSGRVTGLTRPAAAAASKHANQPDPRNSLYSEFMRQKQEEVAPSSAPSAASSAPKHAATRGTLASFMKAA